VNDTEKEDAEMLEAAT